MRSDPITSEYAAADAALRLREIAGRAPYRCVWFGGQHHTETIPVATGPAVIEQVKWLWGFLVGSAHLGDDGVGHWIVERGFKEIDAFRNAAHLNHRFLHCLLFNLHNCGEALNAVVVAWGMRFIANPAARQYFLMMAWGRWHLSVHAAAGWDQDQVIAWFKECRFSESLSREVRMAAQRWRLDDEMVVWRGGCGAEPDTIARGLCWTPNRAAAACFATIARRGSGPEPQRRPMVIRREIRPDDVLMCNLSSHPPEMILAPSDTWAVDTGSHEWEQLGRDYLRVICTVEEAAADSFIFAESAHAKLDLFLDVLGATRDDLERGLGRKVRLSRKSTGVAGGCYATPANAPPGAPPGLYTSWKANRAQERRERRLARKAR